MRFVAPGWLWLLLALPLLYALIARDEKRRQSRFEKFAARPLWRALAPEMDPSARLRKAALWLGVVAMVVVSLARPQWGTHEETVKTTGLDIMVALDVSSSMDTEDVVPSRLKKARHVIKSLVEQLRGDRVGIVAFAASAFVACPLTTDSDYVIETLQVLGPRTIASQGTDVGIGIDTARKALDRGAEEAANAAASPADPASSAAPQASRVIVLISDGEDHEESALVSAQALRESGVRLFVLGLGTEKGGPVPVRDDAGNLVGHKRTRKGEAVVSRFKPDALMNVAKQGGGRYWNVTAGEGEVQELLKELGALDRTEFAERKYLVYEDRFQFPLALAVLLLLIEISLPLRKVRRSAVPTAPAASVALAVVLSLSLSVPARAEALLGRQPPLGAYLDNEKGIQAFKDGKLEEAEKKFGNAQARDPNLPELQFNQGIIQLEKGDVDTAAQAFVDAAQTAARLGDPALESRSLYNLGGALGKKGDVQGAVGSYLGAIASAQRAKDAQLEADARRNLELLIQERQKQKQQEQKDGKSKDDQEKKEGQENPNQDQKDKKDESAQAKNQPKKYEDPSKSRRRQFRSTKLSKEDAERVMAELSNRERELQGKLKKQKGNPGQEMNEKDW